MKLTKERFEEAFKWVRKALPHGLDFVELANVFELANKALAQPTEPHIDCQKCGRPVHPRTVTCSPCASLAQPAAQEWRPIESAPKDTDVLLLIRRPWLSGPSAYYQFVGFADCARQATEAKEGWQPLPQPPKPEGE